MKKTAHNNIIMKANGLLLKPLEYLLGQPEEILLETLNRVQVIIESAMNLGYQKDDKEFVEEINDWKRTVLSKAIHERIQETISEKELTKEENLVP